MELHPATLSERGRGCTPQEVEEVLKALPWVEDALVFGLADDPFGERVASFKVPRAVVIVDEVPRTQVGKPDYPSARELFETHEVEPTR